jgi:hypothetical protein
MCPGLAPFAACAGDDGDIVIMDGRSTPLSTPASAAGRAHPPGCRQSRL